MRSAFVGRGGGRRKACDAPTGTRRGRDRGRGEPNTLNAEQAQQFLACLLTPHGLRRTFNDLMRVAKVEALVTKSISGHLTDRMREHYSTVSTIEQRESMGQVLRLVRPEPVPGGGAPGGAPTPPSGAPREEGAA